jgi:hypothetical protein
VLAVVEENRLDEGPLLAGITTSVRMVDEVIPPIIGTAMRCMTSEPAPVLHRIGTRPSTAW